MGLPKSRPLPKNESNILAFLRQNLKNYPHNFLTENSNIIAGEIEPTLSCVMFFDVEGILYYILQRL